MQALVNDGTLTIEVRMKKVGTTIAHLHSSQFTPKNPLCKNILQLFMDEESADVVFAVGSEQSRDGRKKRAKTSTVAFYAHNLILQKCAPALAEMCGSGKGDVPITDVKPDIFRHVLYYIYGGEISDEDMKANAKDIIDAADKYAVVNLKLEADLCYVKSTAISVDNFMDNLLYAEAKNCALLKEAVIDFAVENGQDVLEKVPLKDVPGGVFADILAAVTREKKSDTTTGVEGDQLSTMRVNELRNKLEEKGLDIDGSRETMISLLKESP